MNKATRIIVVTLGVIFGISGINHGLLETFQGNTPTGGLFISAIGESYKFWPHGNEFAITLIPNFLITGIAAMIVGLAIIIWSVGFVHKRYGPIVLILLFVLLFLVGGGIAQIIFFILIWGVATRINKPLTRWRRILPGRIQESLGKVWPSLLIVSSSLIVFVLEIGIFGFVPTVNDPDVILSIMTACLALGYGLLLLTIVAGFAHDITISKNND